MWPDAHTPAGWTPVRAMTSRMARKTRKMFLKDWLRDPVDEAALSRMWHAIDSRFQRGRSRTSHFLTLVPTIVLAASTGTAACVRHDPDRGSSRTAGQSPRGSIFVPR